MAGTMAGCKVDMMAGWMVDTMAGCMVDTSVRNHLVKPIEIKGFTPK